NNINNSLLEIERARGFLDAAKLKKSWIRNMQSKALILESHASTHIEKLGLLKRVGIGRAIRYSLN
ncbi:Fic family protein, partial [candidate division WOR-3 bacterium]|nr:Fic family protein [candidate division WOR-3 bacterium]